MWLSATQLSDYLRGCNSSAERSATSKGAFHFGSYPEHDKAGLSIGATQPCCVHTFWRSLPAYSYCSWFFVTPSSECSTESAKEIMRILSKFALHTRTAYAISPDGHQHKHYVLAVPHDFTDIFKTFERHGPSSVIRVLDRDGSHLKGYALARPVSHEQGLAGYLSGEQNNAVFHDSVEAWKAPSVPVRRAITGNLNQVNSLDNGVSGILECSSGVSWRYSELQPFMTASGRIGKVKLTDRKEQYQDVNKEITGRRQPAAVLIRSGFI